MKREFHQGFDADGTAKFSEVEGKTLEGSWGWWEGGWRWAESGSRERTSHLRRVFFCLFAGRLHVLVPWPTFTPTSKPMSTAVDRLTVPRRLPGNWPVWFNIFEITSALWPTFSAPCGARVANQREPTAAPLWKSVFLSSMQFTPQFVASNLLLPLYQRWKRIKKGKSVKTTTIIMIIKIKKEERSKESRTMDERDYTWLMEWTDDQVIRDHRDFTSRLKICLRVDSLLVDKLRR